MPTWGDKMNRLSEYITGMTLTRQLLKEAKIRVDERSGSPEQKTLRHQIALHYLIGAFDSFVSATNCAISIREKKKPKK